LTHEPTYKKAHFEVTLFIRPSSYKLAAVKIIYDIRAILVPLSFGIVTFRTVLDRWNYLLCNGVVSSSDCYSIASNGRMIIELERIGKEAVVVQFKALSWHLLRGTKENDEKLGISGLLAETRDFAITKHVC
jgi:hypothetical protein